MGGRGGGRRRRGYGPTGFEEAVSISLSPVVEHHHVLHLRQTCHPHHVFLHNNKKKDDSASLHKLTTHS